MSPAYLSSLLLIHPILLSSHQIITEMGRFLLLFVLLAASTIGLANPCLLMNEPDFTPTSEEPILSVSADIQTFLNTHNSFRAKHGASPLVWDGVLASKAQQWANGCKFKHSGGTLGPYGGSHLKPSTYFILILCYLTENLAAGTGNSYDIAAAVKSWTDEACK